VSAEGLSDDAVRDLFSAYHDRELPEAQHDAVRAALEANPALQKEYAGFTAMLDGLSGLGLKSDAPTQPDSPPEVLTGVQRKLHKRSGGRFYADRWSRVAGTLPLELLAAAVLVALVVAYFAMTSISVTPVAPPR
jgi:anti-sigma factor RsiW